MAAMEPPPPTPAALDVKTPKSSVHSTSLSVANFDLPALFKLPDVSLQCNKVSSPHALCRNAYHWIVAKAAAPSRLHLLNHPDLLLVQSDVLFAQI
jgi:hypothetical protein